MMEVLGSVPRDVRLTANGIAVVAFAILLAVAAIVIPILLSILYVRSAGEGQRREREVVWVNAEVQQVVVRNGERPRRVVTYRLEAAGRNYSSRVTLRRSDQRAVARGGPIRVGYASSHPERSWASGYEPSGMPLGAIPLATALLLPAAAGCAWSVRRQWILLSEGRATQARITGHKKVHSDKHRMYRVSYEFQTINGARQTSRYDVGKTPPPIGSIVPIVYHREKPEWSAPYPLTLVRPGRPAD